MSSEIKVRSRFRKEVDDEALGLAFVLLARILAEEEELEAPPLLPGTSVPIVAAGRGVQAAKPLRQRYYEEVEALKATGWSNPEALREVSRRFGKRESAVRQGIYMYRRDKGLAA
jgi:hypothetical protein